MKVENFTQSVSLGFPNLYHENVNGNRDNKDEKKANKSSYPISLLSTLLNKNKDLYIIKTNIVTLIIMSVVLFNLNLNMYLCFFGHLFFLNIIKI